MSPMVLSREVVELVRGGSKGDKVSFLKGSFPTLLASPRAIEFEPTEIDEPPFDAALNWGIVATEVIKGDTDVLGPEFLRSVGTIEIDCSLRDQHEAVKIFGNQCRFSKTQERLDLVPRRLKTALFFREFERLPNDFQQEFKAVARQGWEAAELFAHETYLVVTASDQARVTEYYERCRPRDPVASAKRFTMVHNNAVNRGWRRLS